MEKNTLPNQEPAKSDKYVFGSLPDWFESWVPPILGWIFIIIFAILFLLFWDGPTGPYHYYFIGR
jgi:hypothetical protein